MTDYIQIPRASVKREVNQGRWQRYLVFSLLANAAIWVSALVYLQVEKPTYTSQMAVTLPGAASDASVNLPNIGQASYQNASPYANSATQDPRETYKVLATSKPVLTAAANRLNMSLKSFGKPRIKIIDNTTVIQIEFKGASPEQARSKSLALYQALQAKLNQLRSEEAIQRDLSSQSVLNASQKKLAEAQKKLSAYKAFSNLSASDQLNELSQNIEQIRRQKAEIVSQQQQTSSRLRQLSATLNLSPQQATDAFVLQTDEVFQQNLKDYSEASASLATLSSKFLPNHPTISTAKAKRDAAQQALLTRSESLLGRPFSQEVLQHLSLSSTKSDAAREGLFRELVNFQVEQQGLKDQASEVDQQIAQLEDRLRTLAQREVGLDDLKRDVQVAEAVFSSTIARLDVGRANVYNSYPLMQILVEPGLPDTPSWPKKEFVFLGAVLGSLLLSAGVINLWLRESKSWERKS